MGDTVRRPASDLLDAVQSRTHSVSVDRRRRCAWAEVRGRGVPTGVISGIDVIDKRQPPKVLKVVLKS